MVTSRSRRRFSVCRDGPWSPAFTLIELLVVMAVVALLLTLALPRYFHSVDRAKETVLRENLKSTRDTIDKFYSDTGRYPANLEELVEKKYLRSVPFDPVVENSTSWTIVPPQDSSKSGVYSIRSSAPGVSSDGVPYANF